ncbi:Hypothetical protein CINCED_3A013550 [Cinara cedri]|uniref:Uncharacterized protein n=1 Tax=Cinara cedri TaxID=506608 RepID=A0A5E4MBI0_9HEMI|nr:Hypothetical protein CINCED_3A013550 [Cinara cedri]
MSSKPNFIDNETTESRRPETLAQHVSITDDYSNDRNQSNSISKIKRFNYSHTDEISVKSIKNCSDSYKAINGIVSSTIVKTETINVLLSINVKYMTVEDPYSERHENIPNLSLSL